MQIIKLLPIIFILVGCYNRFDDRLVEGSYLESNYTIERLHADLDDRSFADITADLVVRGVVTANDESGSIYNSFMVENDGYAMEVLVELSNSYVKFPEGNIVYVALNGLRAMRSWGVVQVGLPASNWGEIEDISGMIIIDNHIAVTNSNVDVTAEVVRLDDLLSMSESELNSYYGRLVELQNMMLEPNDYLNPSNLWSGTNTFVQCDDLLSEDEWHSISIYTLSYANYSQITIPSGLCTLTGTLEQGYNTSLGLTMRRSGDCTSIY
ncbi:MAG: DUF5689 domain-containing protein [Rikenellaceae bacterium]